MDLFERALTLIPMHNIEPFYRWLPHYDSSADELSPFFEKEYNYDLYSENIYGYYIDPAWDYIGSETLYIKILFTDYDRQFAILEFIGEWNDAINNDIMVLKRNIVDHMILQGIRRFILLGENVLNFHGSDDCYYEEWFEDLEDAEDGRLGWIVAINFRDFVLEEWSKYNIDGYFNYGGSLQIEKWRTMSPYAFFELVAQLTERRLI